MPAAVLTSIGESVTIHHKQGRRYVHTTILQEIIPTLVPSNKLNLSLNMSNLQSIELGLAVRTCEKLSSNATSTDCVNPTC